MTPVDIDLPLSAIPETQVQKSKFKAVHTVIEMGATTSYMGELVRIKNNLFLSPMQYLQIVLSVGYYTLLIPFRISADDEQGYKLITNPVQGTLSCILLVISTINQLVIAETMWENADWKLHTKATVKAVESTMTAMMMITYFYTCILKRHRFMNMFERFKSSSMFGTKPSESWNTKKRYTWISCTVLLLFTLSNWNCWGQMTFDRGMKNTAFSIYSNRGYLIGLLPSCGAKSTACFSVTGIITLILGLLKEAIKTYIDIVMCGIALSLYNMELTTKRVLITESGLEFDIKKGIDVFRIINNLIEELGSAWGPITVAYYMELIPYTVSLVLPTDGNGFQWYHLFIPIFKLGHILLTAETNANAKNLVNQILANQIKYTSENIGRVLNIKSVMRNPIALRGMDFFEVTYPFLGAVALSVVTYCLLVIELQDPLSKKLPI